jgi:hypothetical protein
MAQQLKRWESPRKEGRNDKGRGGSARRRQKAKQFKRLKQTLIDLSKAPAKPTQTQDSGRLQKPNSKPNSKPTQLHEKGTKKERHDVALFLCLFRAIFQFIATNRNRLIRDSDHNNSKELNSTKTVQS